MGQTPMRIIDRRSSTGYVNTYGSLGGNRLIDAAIQSPDRKYVQMMDRDTSRNVNSYGRRTLLSLGRKMFWNIPAVRGAVLEQSNLSVGTFIPQFTGRDHAYGQAAEQWLMEWDKICDVQGWPYDGNSLRNSMVVHSIVDGEFFILLTEGADGYPLIQAHPAHRIGTRNGEVEVKGGQFDGNRIIDGAILDDVGRIVGYRYIGDNLDSTGWDDIPASNLFPVFFPEFSDVYRNLSGLATCLLDFSDVHETRGYEKLAQKIAATIALIERNESGEPDSTKAIINAGTTGRDSSTGNLGSLYQETLDGGMIRYLRAGSGAGLETLKNDRPSQAQQSFEANLIRSAMAGMEWSSDFSLDPSKVGGAQMRVVIDKINRVLSKRQRMVAKAMRRIHGYALSKAAKLGLLPNSPEWHKFTYQGPAELTADKKYQSDVDLQEYRAGWLPLDDVTSRRNLFWEKVQDQRIAERKRLEVECAKQGIDPEKIEILTPNGNPTAAPEPAAANP